MDAKEVKERLNKVVSLYNSKNYEMALVELDDLANTVPDMPEVYFWRGKNISNRPK